MRRGHSATRLKAEWSLLPMRAEESLLSSGEEYTEHNSPVRVFLNEF
jgi:hypothetical protein